MAATDDNDSAQAYLEALLCKESCSNQAIVTRAHNRDICCG